MNNPIENTPDHGMPASPSSRGRAACGSAGDCAFPGGKVVCRILLCGAAALLTPACVQVHSPQPGPDRRVAEGGPVILGEGDVVKLFFPGAAEYTGNQKIRTDGKLSLPIIGEFQAAGKTVSRLQSELTARYKSQLQNSEVVVSLEASGKPVIISGGVVSPGKFVFDRPTTLLEAVMGAGGFKDFARKRKVRLTRLVNGHYQTTIYDMRDGRAPVIPVYGGDMIDVPMSNW